MRADLFQGRTIDSLDCREPPDAGTPGAAMVAPWTDARLPMTVSGVEIDRAVIERDARTVVVDEAPSGVPLSATSRAGTFAARWCNPSHPGRKSWVVRKPPRPQYAPPIGRGSTCGTVHQIAVTCRTGFLVADRRTRTSGGLNPDVRAGVESQAAGATPRCTSRPGCQGVPSSGSRKRSTPIQPALRQARMRKIAKKARIGLVLTVPASR